MKKTAIYIICLLLSLPSLGQSIIEQTNLFIGTGGHGHTFPHAMVPFGAVAAGPDWAQRGWDAAGGYHYDSKSILGFSQIHLSGTGLTEAGDFLIQPTVGKIQINAGKPDVIDDGYRSRFSHEDEQAHPGYYQVRLQDYDVNVEVTATERTGFYKMTFPKSDSAHVLIDLMHHINGNAGSVKHASLSVKDQQTVTGYRLTNGIWANHRQLYFAMRFSKPFESKLIYDANKYGFTKKHFFKDLNHRVSDKLKAVFNFKTEDQEAVYVKIAVSSVSAGNALENLEKEIPDWDFDRVKKQAEQKWEKELSKITVSGDQDRVAKFYTALYHNFIHPTLNQDVNGQYRGMDHEVHQGHDFEHYTMFSLWDTFRATHPLLTLTQPERTDDIMKTMTAFQQENPEKMLPMWSMYQNENTCMIGLHAIPVLADAFYKGLYTGKNDRLLESMVASAENPGVDSTAGRAIYPAYYGQKYYIEKGYHPNDVVRTGVSVTLEHAYDDWALALAAKKMGQDDVAEKYRQRAQNYRNVWDKERQFFRAKLNDGKFREPFDPRAYHREDFHDRDYTEGNAWQYLFFVPHDVYGLAELMGGEKQLESRLDELFTLPYQGESSVGDVSGLIGDYAHGNEPCHHVAYLYGHVRKPSKTQALIHRIDREFYKNAPDGYIGNEDAGQMSAWYVFSAMGFYPVNPAGGVYVFGSPLMESASIKVGDGKTFNISVENYSPENIYIKSIKLNGKKYQNVFIRHEDIIKGGKLEYVMTNRPTRWGEKSERVPFADGGL